MRLSDAIALGRTLCCPRRGGSDAVDSNLGDGCVLDMAVLAAVGTGDWHNAEVIWPWIVPLTEEGINSYQDEIIHKFDSRVMYEKTLTLDQLIDWIRLVEPPDPAEKFEAVAAQAAEGVKV